jgi:micrococcal nuclease
MVKFLVLLLVLPAQAQECEPSVAMGPNVYAARYLDNYDGDTVRLSVTVWPNLHQAANVRLVGVDTPEIRGECDREKERAQSAKEFVRATLDGQELIIIIHGSDKYGRPLVTLLVSGHELSDMIIAAGMGREYDGGARLSWCGPET